MDKESGVVVVRNPEKPTQDLVLFYGRRPVFSNFYISPFKIGKLKYNCTEQYFQHKKAMFFEDHKTAGKIMKTQSPAQQKKLGRRVKGYDELRWMQVRKQTMESGCMAKFTQNQPEKEKLLATGDSLMVECSPTDKIWGIGLGLKDHRAKNPKNWVGQNLMGKVLENVRELIANND